MAHWRVPMVLGTLVLTMTGCGAGDDTTAPLPVPATPCAPGDQVLEDDSCLPPGVPADGCPDGFEHDGTGGCVAVIAPEPCPDGLVAMLGETTCRPLASCPAGPYPEVPSGPVVIYVDGAYGGSDSDGSQARPWPTVPQAVDAAPAGAVIAIAAGGYSEPVTLTKPLTLWGACPERVELVGPNGGGAVRVLAGASGSVLRGLALTGPLMSWPAIAISGAEEVLVQEVWVHDTPTVGIYADDELGPTSIVLRDVLVERSHDIGIMVTGARADIERTLVRFVAPGLLGGEGRGINIQAEPSTMTPAQMSLRQSIVEHADQLALFVGGSQADIAATLMRDIGAQATLAGAGNVTSSRGQSTCVAGGVQAQRGPDTSEWAWLELGWSRVERNHTMGVAMLEANGWIHDVLIADTRASAADGFFGDGLVVESLNGGAQLDATNVVVADSARAGLASFSGSTSLAQDRFECNAIDINAETHHGAFGFEDLGGNQCGCGNEQWVCKAGSSGLLPPEVPGL